MKNNPLISDLKFRSQVTDLKRRQKYAAKELQSLVLKAVLVADSMEATWSASFSEVRPSVKTKSAQDRQLQNLRTNTITRVRNRCVLSGRSSTLNLFRLSRICFREQAGASTGKLIGISKRLNK